MGYCKQIFAGALMAVGFVLTSATFAASEDYPVDTASVALLPAKVKAAGVLRIAMPDQGAPFNFKQGEELKGMEPDLARAIAATLGLKPEITLTPFTSAIPGLQASKFDLSFGQFYIRKDRLQVVDFISDWKTYNVFMVLKEKGIRPTQILDLCGHSVGAMSGTVQLDALQKNNGKCTSGTININAFPSMANAVLALSSGRIDAVFVDPDVSRAARKDNSDFVESGKLNEGLTAIAVARNEQLTGLAEAVRSAMVKLDQSGAYKKILDAYGTGYGAIDKFDIYKQDSVPPVYQ
ncbi:transporter substrate-binding domain-containing protein [Pseudomonas sp. NY15181]|uniref:transporter substrate-binding domain-containing protein n=1 Tax=Pseudomonas sp. NY15181 TaxID=3400349 RepID=UPI003A896B20